MSTNVNVIPDTWENRILQASKVIGKTPQEFETILNTPPYNIQKDPMGLELLSDEEATPFGDFRKLFCEQNKVSLPLLRIAMKFLRGPKGSAKTDSIDPDILDLQSKYGIKTKIEDLDIEQLMQYYNPRKNNVIHEALQKKYGKYGKFIVFKPDSEEVDIEATVNYITDLEDGYNAEESIEVDGELVPLYSIGQVPFETIEEDPFNPGFPLKRGRSTVNRINWSEVSMECRQFWRVVYSAGGVLKVDDPITRVNIIALLKKELVDLKSIFPEAYLQFKTLKKSNNLPSLTISIQEMSTKKNDPFSINRNRQW